MSQKYQLLTNITKQIIHPRTKLPIKLYRIIATSRIQNGIIVINEGQTGGWIQSEKNLPNKADDNSWIAHNGMVFDDAVLLDGSIVMQNAAVYDKAVLKNSWVKEHARVYGNSKLIKSQVSGNVDIYGDADLDFVMCNNASKVGGRAIVKNSKIVHGAYVTDDAYLDGCELYDMARVYGKSRLINCVLKSAMLVRDETFENQTLSRDIELNASYPEIQGQF